MIPKFRAWDNDEKIMHNHINIVVDENGSLEAVILKYEFNGYDFCELEVTEQDNLYIYYEDTFPYIIMQSTGLKDKNGVEIFEGDILTTEQYPYQVEGEYNYHGVVEWDKESAGYIVVKYVVNPLISGISNGMADRFEEVDGFEVIGNIYKNPELLEAHT